MSPVDRADVRRGIRSPSDVRYLASLDLSSDVGRARYFRYNVEQGGFAQLLFNLGGEHLQEFAEMLDRAGATLAAGYYERALLACLDDESAYQAFLSGDYISENSLKSTLQLLSLEYLRAGRPFDREAAAWLIATGAARGLLIGSRGAHSGSSTTYAYLGEVRDDWLIPVSSFLEVRLQATPCVDPPVAMSSASLERQGRGAGLVGVRFTPEAGSNQIVVRVAVGPSRSERDTIGLSPDEAQAVLDGIVSQASGSSFRELGPGRLEVLWATRHEVDSAGRGFNRLSRLLVPLLALPVDADDNAVVLAWRRQRESVSLAEMGRRLASGIAGHPERGVFRAGATETELKRLEGSVGQALPEAIREWSRQFNGGSFVDDRPQQEEAGAEPTCTCCELLCTEEMATELFDLIAVNDASTQVDRWEGSRPVHPKLRRPDGTLSPWPYLPVARTVEGREVLVVELTGAGRVLDAFHEASPHQWRMVYERYVDFIEDFLRLGGCLPAIAR